MDLRAVIFVPALVGSTIFVFLFLLFAAHHYLTVMQSTGAGARNVEWVSEPLLDNFWKVFYLMWLVGLWFGPAYLLGRAVVPEGGWLGLAVPLAFLCVMYPISQLSSLSASTIWLPLHPEVFGRLAQRFGVWLGFLLFSGLTMAVLGVGFRWAFQTKGENHFLFLGSVLVVVGGLVYARLVGRLAFLLMYTKPVFVRKKKKLPKSRETFADPRPPESGDDFVQPTELPPIQTPFDGEVEGYGVKFDDEPKPKKRVVAETVEEPAKPRKKDRKRPASEKRREWTEEDEDDTAYGMREAETTPEPARPKEVIKPSAIEMRLMAKDDAPKPPKEAWSVQLLAFLVHTESLPVVGLLVVLCVLAGGFVRIAREFNPVG
jgi:hypothetical protein